MRWGRGGGDCSFPYNCDDILKAVGDENVLNISVATAASMPSADLYDGYIQPGSVTCEGELGSIAVHVVHASIRQTSEVESRS